MVSQARPTAQARQGLLRYPLHAWCCILSHGSRVSLFRKRTHSRPTIPAATMSIQSIVGEGHYFEESVTVRGVASAP